MRLIETMKTLYFASPNNGGCVLAFSLKDSAACIDLQHIVLSDDGPKSQDDRTTSLVGGLNVPCALLSDYTGSGRAYSSLPILYVFTASVLMVASHTFLAPVSTTTNK